MPLSLSPSLLMSSASSVAFSPLSLFASGEQGAWYDPSDLSTMFQDTAGTTPVTATGQTVGLLLDKSRGATTPFGPELVTNGDFSTNTDGWTATNATLSVVAAQLVVTNSAAAFGGASQAIPVTVGRTYTVSGANFSSTGTSNANIGSSLNGGDYGNIGGAQIWSRTFVATGPTVFISLRCVDAIAGRTAIFDTISLKEWTGNHATQATAASRPIYGIEPFGGRRNLLVRTEEFDNAAWGKINAAATANATTSPDGTTTAEKLASNNATGGYLASQNVTLSAAVTYTYSVYLKASELGFALMHTGDSVAVGVNLSTGAATSQLGSPSNIVSQSAGNGWWRISFSWTATATSNSVSIYLSNDGLWANRNSAITIGSGVFIWGAQLETGSTATAYQRVTDQWNVTQAGVPSVAYLAFDGTDDFLLTGTITPGIDKAQVFAGVRKLSDVAESMLLETSTTISSGSLRIYAPRSGNSNYSWRAGGSSLAEAASASIPAPTTSVLTGIGDIAADTCILRVNGSQVATSTADQGTGNFLAYPLYIGRRAGTSLPFNGRIYGLAVRFGANLSAAQISQMETWLNARTGAF